MDLEQRVQVLEQEVQVLKNQIQATLLEMQEYLLTNAHPSLRAEDTPRSSAARPQSGALRKVSFNDDADEPDDDEPPISGVRKVSLNAADEPAPRKSNGKRKAARSADDEDDEPEAPRKPSGVRKVSLEDVEPDAPRPKKQSGRAADWDNEAEPAPKPVKASGKRSSQPKHNGHTDEADELPGVTFYQAEPVEARKPGASRTMEAPAEPHQNGSGKQPASQAMVTAKPSVSRNGSSGKADPVPEDDIDHTKKTVLRLIAGLYNAGAGVKKDK